MTDLHVNSSQREGRKFLIFGALISIVAAVASFFIIYKELIPLSGEAPENAAEAHPENPKSVIDVAFVELPPLLVPMGKLLSNQHLRFRAELEVEPLHEAEVAELVPRIVDVLNGYLRALEKEDFEKPAALILLRSNMLRRVQTVVGDGKVKNLLIMEFVVN